MKLQDALIPLTEILIPPNRQRRDITREEIESFADDISRHGLLHPITLEPNPAGSPPWILVAGERRLRVFQYWNNIKVDGVPLPGWDRIPARCAEESLDPSERDQVELIENIKRRSLSWQDECRAILKIHDQEAAKDEDWTVPRLSGLLNMDTSAASRSITVAREMGKDPNSFVDCKNLTEAYAVVSKRMRRDVDRDIVRFTTIEVAPPSPDSVDGLDINVVLPPDFLPKKEEVKLPSGLPFKIVQEDFINFVKNYADDIKFDFIHCDFPYGIGLHKSDQMDMSKFDGKYQDTDDVYWNLCEALILASEIILAPAAHIMFWFPMSKYTETVTFFQRSQFRVDPYPLIWVKEDKSGILPDPNRGPRRIYETALLMSLGDRWIVRPTVNAAVAQSEKRTKTHASYKPEAALDVFLPMFIRPETIVLDPTCGSGSALAVAIRNKAAWCLGLDTSAESVDMATTNCLSAHQWRESSVSREPDLEKVLAGISAEDGGEA